MSETRKIGEGSLRAAVRQGFKEVGQILPAFPGPLHTVEEPGTFNNPTTYEVSKQTGTVRDQDVELDHEPEMEP